MPPDRHRTPESGPDGPRGSRCPQTATGRRRAALTALGVQMPPDRHRTPESGPDGPRGSRCPQTATGRRRAALTALGVQMPPDRHRTPESGPDGPRGPDAPQTATGRRRAALTALGGPDAPRPPQDAPFSAKSPPLVLTRFGGGTPSETPFYLTHLGRAPAQRVRARIMRPRARFWLL